MLSFRTWVELAGGAPASARKLGVSPYAVWTWLAGTRAPTMKHLIAIIRASRGKLDANGLVKEFKNARKDRQRGR